MIDKNKAPELYAELVQTLGFDPAELDTVEVEAARFGWPVEELPQCIMTA